MSGGGGGGGGSSQKATNYYMAIHYGICAGPVNWVNYVRVDDKKLPIAAVAATSSVAVNAPGLFGGKTQYGGVQGTIDFMIGGDTQVVTPQLAALLGRTPSTCPGFRGLTSLFFHRGTNNGFYWRSNMPAVPPVSASVTRYPAGPVGDVSAGPGGTANPAHIIYEVLFNDDWGMGYPVNMLDIDSFRYAATTLASEGMWLSMLWVRSTTVEEFCGEVLDHIQATLGLDPLNGKIKLKLLRADYDVDTLRVLHPGNADITNLQRKLWGETANEITVSWTNPDSEKEETVTIHDDANIAIQGQVVSSSRNYYGVRTAELAAKLALRDLRQVATPLLAVDIEIDRTEWDIMPGEVVELRWPEEGIASMYMRVGDVDYGATANSRIRTSLVEDIFGLGSAVYEDYVQPKPGDPAPTYPPPKPGEVVVPPTPTPVPPTPQPPEWEDPTEQPRPLDFLVLDTAPYFVLARAYGDDSITSVLYPSSQSIVLTSQTGSDTSAVGEWAGRPNAVGQTEMALIQQIPVFYRGYTAAAMVPAARSTMAAPTGVTGEAVAQGYMLWIADPAHPEVHELAAIETISTDGTWTIRRGVLDTIPLDWPVNTPVWAFDPTTGTALDPTIRADGEEVTYRFTPITSAGQLDISAAPDETMTVSERPYQPYRPANLKIGGVAYFGGTYAPGLDQDVVITWSRRNRVTETGQLMVWTDGDVNPEPGQTTYVSVRDALGVEVFRQDGITGTSVTIPAATVINWADGYSISVGSARGGMTSLSEIKVGVSMQNYVGYGLRYGYDYGGAD